MHDQGSCIVFFFFQAEDGIRDVAVTGVQTCALPILLRISRKEGLQNSWPSRGRCTRLEYPSLPERTSVFRATACTAKSNCTSRQDSRQWKRFRPPRSCRRG